MGQCNFCTFKSIKSKAKKEDMTIKKLDGSWGMGGIEIFKVPKDISLSNIKQWKQPSDNLPNGDQNWQKYHVAWFKELPNHCCC